MTRRGRGGWQKLVFGYTLGPIFALFGFIFVNGYKVVFGWWLDKRLAIKDQARFAEDIRRDLSFLFTEQRAVIVPNEGTPFPPAFDYSFVTVVSGNIRLRFCRGRRELRLEVGPISDSRDLNEISTVLRAIGSLHGFAKGPEYRDLPSLGRLLHDSWKPLQEAFSEKQYPTTREDIRPVQEQNQRAVRAIEARIQRR